MFTENSPVRLLEEVDVLESTQPMVDLVKHCMKTGYIPANKTFMALSALRLRKVALYCIGADPKKLDSMIEFVLVSALMPVKCEEIHVNTFTEYLAIDMEQQLFVVHFKQEVEMYNHARTARQLKFA